MQKDKNPHGFMVQSFNGKKKTVTQSRKHSLKTELTSSQTTLHRLKRISSWSKMKQFAAIMFKFKDILLDIIKPKTINTPGQFVDMSLLQRRESSITKMYQQRCFQNKTNRLADGKYVSRKSNISKLDPFLDDHKVIRVGGRISQSRMEYKLKHPILLSKYQRMVILHQSSLFFITEELVKHGGREMIIKEIRKTLLSKIPCVSIRKHIFFEALI